MPIDYSALRQITFIVDRGGYAVGNYDNSVSLLDNLRSDMSGLSVLNSAGQVIGAVASINPVGAIIGNSIAISVTLNTALNEGFTVGDGLSIAGNLVGMIGGAIVVGAATVNPFTVAALAVAGLSIGLTQLSINETIREKRIVSPTLGTTPDPLVKTIRYVDPLILDLDGDGLEITALSRGILFDANGDTIKTGTAWAGGDDGILVRDINGNGLIDSGRELFGDETILANGQKAAHGFAALRELDTGSAATPGGAVVGANDGIFDAKDAQYANLRIWRDLNQDGISQANELKMVRDLPGMTCSRRGARTCGKRSRSKFIRKYVCSPIKIGASCYEYYINSPGLLK